MIFYNDEEFVYVLPLPGYKKEDIEVKVDNNNLNIRAGRKEKFVSHRELADRKFSDSTNVSTSLPLNVNKDKIEAIFEDGMLQVTIPIVDTARQIPVL
jgi:HSP20 family protein